MQISRMLFKHSRVAKTCLAQLNNTAARPQYIMPAQARLMTTKTKATSEQKEAKKPKTEKDKKVEEKVADEAKKQMKEDAEKAEDTPKGKVETGKDPAEGTQDAKVQKQVDELKTQLSDKDVKIEELTKKLEKSINNYRYQLAENDNTIKRYKEEVKKTKEYSISNFAKDLLTVRDDLQLALDHSQKFDVESETDIDNCKEQFKNLREGVKMTSKVFDKTMKRFNVEEFKPVGEKFDPNLHEAVAMVDDPSKDPNTICDVMTTGWKIGERVLRAPKVFCVKKR